MRLLYVTSRFPFGGGEGFLIPELQELLRRGCDIRIVPAHAHGPIVHRDAAALLRLTEQQPLVSSRVAAAAAATIARTPIRAARAAQQVLERGRPAIRLRNVAAYPKGLWVADIARKWKATHIHGYWAATAASIAMTASKMSGISWSFTGHRWDIVTDDLLVQKVRSASAMRVISESVRSLTKTILDCQLPASDAAALMSKVCTSHIGVAVPVNPPPRASALRVLCPANLIPVKGHTYLLDAFARTLSRCPTAELLLAGDGPLRARLTDQVTALGIGSRVQFLGALPREDLLAMYSGGKVMCVVLPSVTISTGHHEGIPVSLMEAMAFGIPVVASNSGGISELVTPGAGLLVEPGDSESLAEAVTRVLMDSALRQSLSAGGHLRVAESFSVQSCVGEFLRVIGADGGYV
jgi:colanic acid/amylovoran biosynthesis glycosyltransferase